MIWNPQHTPESQVDALVTHIVSEVSSVVDAGFSLTRTELEEVARGIAFYLQQHGDISCVRSDYLLLLISRVLCSLGKQDVASRFVEAVGEELALPPPLLDLIAGGAVLPCSWALFTARLARPSEWTAIGDETVWVIDLNRVAVGKGGCLELALFQGISTAVDHIAVIWDGSRGAGILGLRNLKTRISALYGAPRRRAKAAALPGEITTMCERKLDALRELRHWQERPAVVSLDV